jgi:RNA 2',3'-cyclic 3'-phosphodiesterase
MPRLFTGLQVPANVAAELYALRGGLAGARWIEEENYHITLRFIGDVSGALAREIDAELEQIQRPSFSVILGELTVFGGDQPRAVVVRVQLSPALVHLQADHERRFRQLGIRPEPRKFTPHITLARLRSASSAAVANYLESRSLLENRTFIADEFVLFSSRTSVGGGPYLVEAAYRLGEGDGRSSDLERR